MTTDQRKEFLENIISQNFSLIFFFFVSEQMKRKRSDTHDERSVTSLDMLPPDNIELIMCRLSFADLLNLSLTNKTLRRVYNEHVVKFPLYRICKFPPSVALPERDEETRSIIKQIRDDVIHKYSYNPRLLCSSNEVPLWYKDTFYELFHYACWKDMCAIGHPFNKTWNEEKICDDWMIVIQRSMGGHHAGTHFIEGGYVYHLRLFYQCVCTSCLRSNYLNLCPLEFYHLEIHVSPEMDCGYVLPHPRGFPETLTEFLFCRGWSIVKELMTNILESIEKNIKRFKEKEINIRVLELLFHKVIYTLDCNKHLVENAEIRLLEEKFQQSIKHYWSKK